METTILGVIILIVIIIIFISLGLDKNEEDNQKHEEDEDKIIPKEIYGNIICYFYIDSGLINILSGEFEKIFI